MNGLADVLHARLEQAQVARMNWELANFKFEVFEAVVSIRHKTYHEDDGPASTELFSTQQAAESWLLGERLKYAHGWKFNVEEDIDISPDDDDPDVEWLSYVMTKKVF